MAQNEFQLGLPENFSGVVRLFPLPNLVVFPGVIQALHIFEPRYKTMVQDVMADDQLIAMASYDERETAQSDNPPELFPTVCVSKIIANQALADGRYNLVVVGVGRASLVRELSTEKPYRMADVDVLNEELAISRNRLRSLRDELIHACRSANLFEKLTANKDIKNIIYNDLALGLLVDLIAYVSDLDTQQRLLILKSNNVEERCLTLIELLRRDVNEPFSEFPPSFSNN